MATVTKLKAQVLNKSLPILLSDGSITNYYIGNFLGKLAETGYSINDTEKEAVSAFVNAAINNGYIDAIQYFLPFIGDSSHSFAGCVPLIDNVDDYNMAQYAGTEDYDNFFAYDQTSHKILSVHNSSPSDNIKTPLTFALQKKGFSIMINASFDSPSNQSYFLKSDDAVVNTTTHYVRVRYQASDGNPIIRCMQTSSQTVQTINIDNHMPPIVSNGYNANIWWAYFNSGANDTKTGSFVSYASTKSFSAIRTVTAPKRFDELDYGNYQIGAMPYAYLKAMLFIDQDKVTEGMMNQLDTDLRTLLVALGKN